MYQIEASEKKIYPTTFHWKGSNKNSGKEMKIEMGAVYASFSLLSARKITSATATAACTFPTFF